MRYTFTRHRHKGTPASIMECNIGARSKLTLRTPPQMMRELLRKTPDVTTEVAKIGRKRRNRDNKSKQGKEESKKLEDLKKTVGERREGDSQAGIRAAAVSRKARSGQNEKLKINSREQ